MNRQIQAVVTAVLVGVSAPAFALNEVERNDPIDRAQFLAGSQVTEIDAAVGAVGAKQDGDLDFYRFSGKAGDVVTLDIDNGWGGAGRIDTVIGVFDQSMGLLRMNDDAAGLDPGSASSLDSRIDKFVLPYTGAYVVGVSSYPRYFKTGGVVYSPTYNGTAGDYKLVISGVSPAVVQVPIMIKPGSDEVAPINPKARGKVPVAILGGPNFNALTIDKGSLTFGATGAEQSLAKCGVTAGDLNGDGRADLVCHFENQKAGFKPGDLEGILRGSTTDGTQFEGRGLLKVVPQKSER
jgi:hypothetical protein